jgi:hypothetical protein
MSIINRVHAGVTFLDKMLPSWRSRIDVELLNIADPNNCILGQLYSINGEGKCFSPYVIGQLELGLSVNTACALGFTDTSRQHCFRLARLTIAWRGILQNDSTLNQECVLEAITA